MPEPHPYADGSAEGVVDDVIRLAPAHFEEILRNFGDSLENILDNQTTLNIRSFILLHYLISKLLHLMSSLSFSDNYRYESPKNFPSDTTHAN